MITQEAKNILKHHAGDWQLHRAPGSPDHGESPNFEFQGASPNEQEERNGRSPS